MRCSLSFASTSARVRPGADERDVALAAAGGTGTAPMWSSWPWVSTTPTMSSRRSLDGVEVGQDQVHAGLVLLGEQHAAVDDQQLAARTRRRSCCGRPRRGRREGAMRSVRACAGRARGHGLLGCRHQFIACPRRATGHHVVVPRPSGGHRRRRALRSGRKLEKSAPGTSRDERELVLDLRRPPTPRGPTSGQAHARAADAAEAVQDVLRRRRCRARGS